MDATADGASVNIMAREFESSDEGKTVRTQDGDEVGQIQSVEGGMARVKPESGLTESIRNRLGWTSEDEDEYELDQSKVGDITDDEVRLQD